MKISRRRLLSFVPVGVFFGFIQQTGATVFLRGFRYDGKELKHEPSEAFRKLYHIMVVPDWEKNKPDDFDAIRAAAGFPSHEGNVLIDTGFNIRVTILPNGSIHFLRNTKELIFNNIDDAIAGIYGIEKI